MPTTAACLPIPTNLLKLRGENGYDISMDVLVANRRRMVSALGRLGSEDGARPSRVAGVTLLRAAKSCDPVPVLYEPCIVIVAQGQKRFHVPDGVLTYDPRSYLVVTVPVPADCETTVSPEGPFLGIAVRIDLTILGELLLTMDSQFRPSRNLSAGYVRVVAPSLSPSFSDVAVRLMEALNSESDSRVLGPQLVRELLYRALHDSGGDGLRSLLLGSGARAQIHRVLQRMHLHYAEPLDLATLGRDLGMSSSALHHHFKTLTATSPAKYLKTLRLHKARMLMVQDSLQAAVAAERVGYASPSQFSREFKRLFGVPPGEEAQRVRSAFGFTDQVSVTQWALIQP